MTTDEKEIADFQKRVKREEMKSALMAGLSKPVSDPQKTKLTLSEIKERYGLPKTLATPYAEKTKEKARMAQDSAYGGYNLMWNGLTTHAALEGQFPMTGFVGYPVLQNISQNGLIRACVQTIADDMTREFIEFTGSDDAADKITKLDSYLNRYKIRSLMNRAISSVGYYGGALIFIDTGAKGEELEQPLIVSKMSKEFDKKDNVLRFILVDPVNVTPVEYNTNDPLRDDYLLPTKWQVLGQVVHASRLIRLVDNEPPVLLRPNYNFLGIPQAQILWDYVLHWNKARVEAVELLEKLNLLVFKTDIGEAISSGGIEELDLKVAALNRYRSNHSIVCADMNTEDITNVTLSISGVREITQQALEFVAAINRTPAVKLLGISPSGFNATGESDIRNYYDYIRSKQEKFRDAIKTIVDAIQVYEFGQIDGQIDFEFKPLGTEDELKKSQAANSEVQVLGALLDRNILSPEEVRSYAKNSSNMGLEFIDEDELPEQPEQPQEMQGLPEMPGQEQQAQPGASQATMRGNGTSILDQFIKGGKDAETQGN